MNSTGEDKNNKKVTNYDVLDLWTGTTKYKRIILFSLFGVVAPLACVVVENLTLLCQQDLFNPLPTTGHLTLVLSVPLTNLLLIWCLVTQNAKFPSLVILCGAFAATVELVYAMIFAPYYLVAVLFIIYIGLGLLPLIPLMSLICTLVLMQNYSLLIHRTKSTEQSSITPSKIISAEIFGFVLALAMFVVAAWPNAITYYYLSKAANENAAISHEGLDGLRKWGNLKLLLKNCYDDRGWGSDILCSFGIKNEIPPAYKIREIVYRVTGQPFNSFPRDKNILQGRLDPLADWDFDPDVGGEAVGGVIRYLSLAKSTINESIDSDGHVAYLEWDMTFTNNSIRNQEARMQILLPQGAVVSRATLWVNEHMREATIAKKDQARKAYQAVVQASRDPLLVTTSGTDKVLVQCFPVQPKKEMHIRIGMTIPLLLDSQKQELLLMPMILERNFDIAKPHSFKLACRKPIGFPGFKAAEKVEDGKPVYELTGEMTNKQLANCEAVATVAMDDIEKEIWCKAKKGIIKARIEPAQIKAPSHVYFVIDGSKQMEPFAAKIIEGFKGLPENIDPDVILASEEYLHKGEVTDQYKNFGKDWRSLKTMRYVGGQDNLPALCEAYKLAQKNPGSAVVWIHGTQPIKFNGLNSLTYNLEPHYCSKHKTYHNAYRPVFYDLQTEAGPNRLAEQFDQSDNFIQVARVGNITQSLGRLFGSWKPETTHYNLVMNESPTGSVPANSIQTSDHLARVWAYRSILAKQKSEPEKALELACNYHLVTPVSGAVVLETMKQYKEHDLKPSDPAGVPTVPEPEMWLLFLVSIFIGGIYYLRQKPALATRFVPSMRTLFK